ncbi:hypothetical protein J6590_020215 [Homalodisca vitripennis]|nr:hypothetical protein J6590_020215 [Homalodisca vitripennis]
MPYRLIISSSLVSLIRFSLVSLTISCPRRRLLSVSRSTARCDPRAPRLPGRHLQTHSVIYGHETLSQSARLGTYRRLTCFTGVLIDRAESRRRYFDSVRQHRFASLTVVDGGCESSSSVRRHVALGCNRMLTRCLPLQQTGFFLHCFHLVHFFIPPLPGVVCLFFRSLSCSTLSYRKDSCINPATVDSPALSSTGSH